MFLGATIVLAFMLDRGHDGRLVVIPSVRGDAGLFADFRARTIGAHQQPRQNRLTIGERDLDRIRPMLEIGHCASPQFDPQFFGLHHQCIDQMPVLDHMRERFALLDFAAKGQESRTHGVVEL